MTKAVVDTNVIVSSFYGGNPRKIVDSWKGGAITLCLTRPIVEEYISVLRRMGLQDEMKLQEFLKLLASGKNSLFAAKTPVLKIVASDPDDDKFIECAVALKAEFIVSGDKAVTEIGDYMGIRIVTPREFLDILDSLKLPDSI